MNLVIAGAAEVALTSSRFETRAHYCQRWVRQVVQSVYGNHYDWMFEASAKLTARTASEGGLEIPMEQGSTIGDLLYKTHGSGGAGHVGIRIAGNRVAENSSVHWGEDRDARGVRSLKEFGNFDMIIRLAQPSKT